MYLFVLAERLGRTVDELLYGSDVHRPLRAAELVEWVAHDRIVADEQERARKEQR